MSIRKNLEGTIRKDYPFLDDAKVKDLMETIESHSLAAAAAGFASGILPGAGVPISMMACIGFVTAMYVKVTKKVGIKISKVKLKAIASIALAEIGSHSIVYFVGGVIVSFIPGLSNLVMAAGQYAFTYMAGIMYLSILKEFFNAGSKLEEMTEEAIKAKFSESISDSELKSMVGELMKDYKERKKANEITGNETVDDREE